MGALSTSLHSALSEQYRHEMRNHFAYLDRASWARYRGYEAIGAFFDKQACDEKNHADSVRAYIEERNEALVIGNVTVLPFEATAPLELFSSSLKLEQETTDTLNRIFSLAFDERDFMTLSWVQALIKEQIEEENTFQTILDRFASRGQDIAANHDMDVWIGETFVKE